MNIVHVHDLSDPRLAPYANLRDAELAQRADPLDGAAHGGLFIAEGELVLRRLIASRFATRSVLMTPARVESMRDALETLPRDVPVFLADHGVLNGIVGFNMHRGVLGIGLRGQGLSLEDLLVRPGPLVVLEDLVNHDNLGGIFRNAAALGGPGVGVVLSPRGADPQYRKSLRVSMGTAVLVPFARAAQWPQALGRIGAAGFETWGLTPHEDATPIERAVRDTARRRVAIVLGTEGAGLTEGALTGCRQGVRIPMNRAETSVDSLNVAMAAGIALHCLGGNDSTNS